MKGKHALICYGLLLVVAVLGWFNRAVLLFGFLVMGIITVGVTIFGKK